MRYPTLMRLLGAVLVLACLLTLMSGAIVWFRADKEREETLTEARQLRGRVSETPASSSWARPSTRPARVAVSVASFMR